MTGVEAFSVIASVVSIVLGFFAIWFTWLIRGEANRVNAATMALLVEIRTDAKALSQYGIGELQKYGDTSRQMITGALTGTSSSLHAGITSTAGATTAGATKAGGEDPNATV